MLSKRRLKSLKKLLSGYIFKSGWMAKTKLTHFEKITNFQIVEPNIHVIGGSVVVSGMNIELSWHASPKF